MIIMDWRPLAAGCLLAQMDAAQNQTSSDEANIVLADSPLLFVSKLGPLEAAGATATSGARPTMASLQLGLRALL